jgi:hypothetical protein
MGMMKLFGSDMMETNMFVLCKFMMPDLDEKD